MQAGGLDGQAGFDHAGLTLEGKPQVAPQGQMDSISATALQVV
jgi:hypothetical protein